jgi:DNA-binding IscR family transcriptional regulator
MPGRKDWFLFSIHGLVFLALAQDPNLTVDQIAQKIGRSRWTVLRVLRDLQLADYVTVGRKGTRNAYTLNEEAQFLNPLLAEHKVSRLIDLMREEQG